MTAAAVAAVLTAALVGCTPGSTNPDGTVPQNTPLSAHGLAQEGSQVWAADFIGSQLVRFDPDTGVISERYGSAEGVCSVDDVAVLPGGDLVATCPTQGLVIRVHRGGVASVLAAVSSGVNPVVVEPSGTSVLVGFTFGGDDRLLRIPLDGGPVSTVASGLPALGGFAYGPDGLLYVPTGGLDGSLGGGGLGTIDTTTGAFTPLPLSFPAEPGRTGFDLAVGAAVGADGTVFVAQSLNAAAYAVDPGTGVATLVGPSPIGVGDNIATLADGRVLLSAFTGGRVGVFTPTGGGYTTSIRPIGS
jgi:hypothetical protein